MKTTLSFIFVLMFVYFCTACGKNGESLPPKNESDGIETVSQTQIDEEPETNTIICWGDSITQGMNMIYSRKQKYPDILKEMLGKKYNVLNAGYAGDTSYAVVARAGGYSLTLKNDVIFADGEKTVFIGNRTDGMGFLLPDGTELTKMNVNQVINGSWETMLNINPVKINGEEYKLGMEIREQDKIDGSALDGHYSISLTRNDTIGELILPKGSVVILASALETKRAYCNVILMGANDQLGDNPSDADIEGLINRYKAIIDYSGNNRYIAVIPYGNKAYDKLFVKVFGDKALNFRDLAVSYGLIYEAITATKADEEAMNLGLVPTSLRLTPALNEIHLNEIGYHYLASVIYDRGVELKYWS